MMLTGTGSLSYGELAGERIRRGMMLHGLEEEHDCFSDCTRWTSRSATACSSASRSRPPACTAAADGLGHLYNARACQRCHL